MRRASVVAIVLTCSAPSWAQGGALPPLPPPDAPAPSPGHPQGPPPSSPSPIPDDGDGPEPATPDGTAAAPRPVSEQPSPGAGAAPGGEVSRGVPEYALWLGGRLGALAYGGGLYRDSPGGSVETTGNFVRPGVALEVDVGARLASRFIPYLALELGLMGPGHRFDQSGTSAGTFFYGVGLRYVAGDVNRIGFVGDLSAGFRRIQVSSGTSTWSASGLEIFRLGLGVDLRVHRRITISPMATLSGGALSDTHGDVSFAPHQGDGQTGPAFANGSSIPSNSQAGYYAITVGCGIHADLLGR